MLQGSASKPPYMLGRLERIVRILSYVIRWVAALAPPFREAPKAGSVWKWSAFVFAAMGLAGIAGWSIGGKHDVLNALVVVLYGVLAFVAIMAVGCVVGYRAGYATVVGTVAGACLGAGAVVWNSPALRAGTVSVAGLDISWLVAIPVAGFCALVISYALARLMSRIPRMG